MSENLTKASLEKPTKKPVSWRAGCLSGAVVLVGAFYLILQSDPTKQSQQAGSPGAKLEPISLAALGKQVQPVALEPLSSKWDPSGYARLGKEVWGQSNEYRKWVALAALQSDKCKFVDAISVWERATRTNLAWHVVCGDERFVISEAQARGVQARLDPKATAADRRKYAQTDIPQPMSAAFASFDPQAAMTNCETALKDASVNSTSFATSGTPYFTRDDEAGRVALAGDFSATNAYGATLSAKYRCIVSAVDGAVVGLTTQDALGGHTVIR